MSDGLGLNLDDPFADQEPIRKLPRLIPLASLGCSVAGFAICFLHLPQFGLFRGLGLILGVIGYVLCLLVSVVGYLVLQIETTRYQKTYKSRFDAYDAMNVKKLQAKVSILGMVLSLLPIWYIAQAIGEWVEAWGSK